MRPILVLGLLVPLLYGVVTYTARNYVGEVAILYTKDGEDRTFQTRLWVVSDGEDIWIRAVNPTSPWLDRVINFPEVQLQRGPELKTFTATPLLHRREQLNGQMAETYGWAEWLLAMVEDRELSVPVYLDPFG